MKTIFFIYGTRPEAIKMAPLVKEFKNHSNIFDVKVCLTGQHREMLDQINPFFGISADYDLNLMKPNQTLYDITVGCILGLKEIFKNQLPDLVFVQGDTTTVMAAALSAIYSKIPVAHLEAGLRSYNKFSPFPEEINRIITGTIADYHFAPTEKAVLNLRSEGINDNVYMVGNTVIDALNLGLQIIKSNDEDKYFKFFDFLDFSKKIILITGHRRESFGKGFEDICTAIADVADKYQNCQFVYPVHFNPNVRYAVNKFLNGKRNVFLIEPLDYPYLIWLMDKSFFVLTDSGGIQEEAPALGKPVLVMRDVTERQEGVLSGTAKLVGTDYKKIVDSCIELLEKENVYNDMANAINPYGDGNTSIKVVDIIKRFFYGK